MKKTLFSVALTASLLIPVAGIALAHPDDHACDGHGGELNPAGKGLIRAEEAGGNVSCNLGGPGV